MEIRVLRASRLCALIALLAVPAFGQSATQSKTEKAEKMVATPPPLTKEQHKQAEKERKQAEKDDKKRDKQEREEIVMRLSADFRKLVAQHYSNYNGVGEYYTWGPIWDRWIGIWATHPFFGNYEFEAGDMERIAYRWLKANEEDLRRANVRVVGLGSLGRYGGRSYFQYIEGEWRSIRTTDLR